MPDPVDMSRETKVDWDREIDRGNLVPLSETPSDAMLDNSPRGVEKHALGAQLREVEKHEPEHIQGQAVTAKDLKGRLLTREQLEELTATKRYPRPTGKMFFFGGWSPPDKKEDKP